MNVLNKEDSTSFFAFSSESLAFGILWKRHLENTVGMRDSDGDQHFLLFPQCFWPFRWQSPPVWQHLTRDFNPLLPKYSFWCIINRQLLKTLQEKKKQFLLFPQCFPLNRIILLYLSIFLTSYFYLMLNWKSPKLAYEVKGQLVGNFVIWYKVRYRLPHRDIYMFQSLFFSLYPFTKQALVFTKSFENSIGKGEIAGYMQFLLFSQCFLAF